MLVYMADVAGAAFDGRLAGFESCGPDDAQKIFDERPDGTEVYLVVPPWDFTGPGNESRYGGGALWMQDVDSLEAALLCVRIGAQGADMRVTTLYISAEDHRNNASDAALRVLKERLRRR